MNRRGDPSDSDDSSSDDGCTMYSGQAQRYKQARQAKFPTGLIHLVEPDVSEKNLKRVSQDSDCDSDDDDFNSSVKKSKSEDEDDDSILVKSARHRKVETLDDDELESCVEELPQLSSYKFKLRERTEKANVSITVVDDDDEIQVSETSLIEAEDADESFAEKSRTIKVRFRNRIHRITLDVNQYFKSICQELQAICQLKDDTKITLCIGEKTLNPYDTLKAVPITITDIIEAFMVETKETKPINEAVIDPNCLQFKVQTQNRSSSVTISIRKVDRMQVLMEKYAEQTKNELCKLSFQFDGDALQPDDTPHDLDLEGGECIDVYIK